MRPRERRESGKQDLFRSRLDQIIDMNHALVKLARTIDWRFLEEKFGAVYTDKPGQPPLPTRLMAGLAILKHTYDLSDEALCDRWVENPYFQYFCGEEFFQHALVFDRSSLTRWRQRMGEEKLQALLQESLAVATRTEAMKPSDLARVVIDTTVQPKAVMFPTDAKLLNRARERLVRLAKKLGVSLRQSYRRVGKLALITHQRYAHAHQFKRANRSLRKLKTYLGRVIRDIERHIVGNEGLQEAFVRPLYLARRVLEQERRQRGRTRTRGRVHRQGQGASALRVRGQSERRHRSEAFRWRPVCRPCRSVARNPYDGHTLGTVIPQMEALMATCWIAASPMPVIAATTPRPITSSRSTRPARSGASRRRSSASSNGGPPSNPSSATSRNITAWAAITSPTPAATPSTPCSPPPATTSDDSSRG